MNPCYALPSIVVAAILPCTFLVAFYTLGAAIGWPYSLNGSAEAYLPIIAANVDAVRFGYSFYFGACALHAVLAVLLVIHLGAGRRPLLAVAAVIGVLAGTFKMLGIARWLAAMPGLALTLEQDPGTVSIAYETLNDYAGITLGESLGVGLFTGLWFALLALGTGPAEGARALPRWLRGLFAVTATLSLVGFAELYGFDTGPVPNLTGYFQYFSYWFLAGALFLAGRGAAPGST